MKRIYILLVAFAMFCVACSNNKSDNTENSLFILSGVSVENTNVVDSVPAISVQLSNEENDCVIQKTDEFIRSRAEEIKLELEAIDEAIERIKTTAQGEEVLQNLIDQRKVNEALYMFLLQKLEETELSKQFAPANNHTISPPMCGNVSVLPR